MHRSAVILAIFCGVVVLSADALHERASLAPDASPAAADARRTFLAAEAARLRSHFDSVDVELRGRDVSALDARQLARRGQLITWLREYRDAGRFPENDRLSGAMVPFFRDSHGTLCAMAYLIDRAGRGETVDRVARSRNNAYIRQLADDRALVAFLDSVGLSVSEAARIQPQYGYLPGAPDDTQKDSVSSSYALTSMALGGASLATAAINVFAPRYTSGLLGILAGGTELGVGIARLQESGGPGQLAVANTTIGAVAIAAGIRGIMVARGKAARAGSARREGSLLRRLTIAPSPVPSSRSGVGLTFHTSF